MTISQIERLESRGVNSANRMKIVLFLANGPKIMSHVAEICRLSTAAITGLADAMEKSGIVKRIPRPTDRRALYLTLTEKGREALQEIKDL